MSDIQKYLLIADRETRWAHYELSIPDDEEYKTSTDCVPTWVYSHCAAIMEFLMEAERFLPHDVRPSALHAINPCQNFSTGAALTHSFSDYTRTIPAKLVIVPTPRVMASYAHFHRVATGAIDAANNRTTFGDFICKLLSAP